MASIIIRIDLIAKIALPFRRLTAVFVWVFSCRRRVNAVGGSVNVAAGVFGDMGCRMPERPVSAAI
ncbi:hypothetical protein [Sphingomonas sp. Leaf22]|uniref:hypothetical protein n=1 Tax=Sphingomonas sp. Leaf22 TaxID=1735687 RepID=UPI0012E1DBFE|nr:hypothetical protein [Sphingomonas sp. Leaf22]